MGVIAARDAADLATDRYDVVVVGGGIYGAMAHLEASRRGLRSLLVERADFGAETSYNTLRIIHGGLRYLQSIDLRRCWESTGERLWYLNRMRPLVETLPCLLPLYGRGLKRAGTMRIGLGVNDWIAAAATRIARADADVPPGAVLSRASTICRFPDVATGGLEGAGHWTDLRMRSPSRILIEALRWAKQLGGAAMNYVEATTLLCTSSGEVRGIGALDRESGARLELRAPVVVNAAGPGVRELGRRWDRDIPELFDPAAAWNVLFDRPALCDHAVAVRDERSSRASMLFATSLNGRLLVGTGYAAIDDRGAGRWRSTVDRQLDPFIDSINRAAPGLRLRRNDVVHVYAGLLPAKGPGADEPRTRNVVHDHGRGGGPRGLYSLSGIKFTTARPAASRLLERIAAAGAFRGRGRAARNYPGVSEHAADAIFAADVIPTPDDAALLALLARIVAEEGVEHVDDLILRRSNLGDDPERAMAFAPSLCGLRDRWRVAPQKEIERVAASVGARRSAAA